MRFLKLSVLAVTLFFAFSSCNKFSKVMKSKDVGYKLNMADTFYAEKKYRQAQQLYEELYPVFKGTDKFEELYYRDAYCFYYMKNYRDAENFFKGFLEVFPNSNKAEEVDFMHALCFVYWKYLEPEKGKYRWDLIEQALATAEERGQRLMLRVAPYGSGKNDVPGWYRAMVGENRNWKYNNPVNGWVVDAEDPRYAEYFGNFIMELGKRYDGHPALEAVDLSIVGAWGEGAGAELLTQKTRESLVDAYTDYFKKTPLIPLLTDEKTNMYANSRANVGWRVDCIGDLGFWAKDQNGWTHMYDYYPQSIIKFGVKDNWKKAPVSLEICGTLFRWKDKEGYSRDDAKYIFDQTLKWHLSSFNAKSSPIPPELEPLVNDWLKKMGYRFVLRKFSCPGTVKRNSILPFETWWENKGVAPCYTQFPLVIRLVNNKDSITFFTDADIRQWLPGDNIYDYSVFVPKNFSPGDYDIRVALVDPLNGRPKIKLAIEGKDAEGWYGLGKIKIE